MLNKTADYKITTHTTWLQPWKHTLQLKQEREEVGAVSSSTPPASPASRLDSNSSPTLMVSPCCLSTKLWACQGGAAGLSPVWLFLSGRSIQTCGMNEQMKERKGWEGWPWPQAARLRGISTLTGRIFDLSRPAPGPSLTRFSPKAFGSFVTWETGLYFPWTVEGMCITRGRGTEPDAWAAPQDSAPFAHHPL